MISLATATRSCCSSGLAWLVPDCSEEPEAADKTAGSGTGSSLVESVHANNAGPRPKSISVNLSKVMIKIPIHLSEKTGSINEAGHGGAGQQHRLRSIRSHQTATASGFSAYASSRMSRASRSLAS